MGRTILFQLHSLLGISAGLVLAVMGITGATLSFEDEIRRLVNPGVVTVSTLPSASLPLPTLVERIAAQRPDMRVTRVRASMLVGRATEVRLEGGEGAREEVYVHPATGAILGRPRDEAAFEFVENAHRALVLPGGSDGWGGHITGFATLALVFFALSGLYLRWPRRPLDWRSWFVLDLRRTGRNLYRTLHAVIGGWMVVLYLLSGLTGLWWSYGWYGDAMRSLLAEDAMATRREIAAEAGTPPNPAEAMRKAMNGFRRATAGRAYEALDVRLPDTGQIVRIEAVPRGARHHGMFDDLTIDGVTGEPLRKDFHATRPAGQELLTAVFELHSGQYFGLAGRIALFLSSAAMPLFTITGYLLYLGRRKRARSVKGGSDGRPPNVVPAAMAVEGAVLVAFASQGGNAERLATRTAAAVPGGVAVPLSKVTAADLLAATRALFVISTYGEGEPPDGARRFARKEMASTPALSQLRYAVLALGDLEYPQFCAFGRAVDEWLGRCQATRLFDRVEVDREHGLAIDRWRAGLVATIGAFDQGDDWPSSNPQPVDWQVWRLTERRLLNPGSAGAPAYHIALTPPMVAAQQWQAGDIAEIRLDIDAPIPDIVAGGVERPFSPRRQYSIASISPSGSVDLIVRQMRAPDGALGLGSGWLTEQAALGADIRLRLLSNPGFHAPADCGRPLILIGSGTGLAGLLSHIRQRAHDQGKPVWLIHGERNSDRDAFHEAELATHLRFGVITRLDLCWSRDANCGRYVQHVIQENGATLGQWVAAGAAIYVCGSLRRMAPSVDTALRDVLGTVQIDELADAGLYRRDIY